MDGKVIDGFEVFIGGICMRFNLWNVEIIEIMILEKILKYLLFRK
jgi:hypothetical protein